MNSTKDEIIEAQEALLARKDELIAVLYRRIELAESLASIRKDIADSTRKQLRERRTKHRSTGLIWPFRLI